MRVPLLSRSHTRGRETCGTGLKTVTFDDDHDDYNHSTFNDTDSHDSTSDRDEVVELTNLMQLPLEILAGQILVLVPVSDLLNSLRRVSREMNRIVLCDYLWQRRFSLDFAGLTMMPMLTTMMMRQGSSGESSMLGEVEGRGRVMKGGRMEGRIGGGSGGGVASVGWRRLYLAMDRVEVYTWGSNADCRLGYGRTTKKYYESVPKRVRQLDGVGIVQLCPTGWGCHALDRHGNVWAWGRIMESNGVRSDAMPRLLKLPKNVIRLAAGRQVVLAQDRDGQVWQWCRENEAVQVTFGPNISNGNGGGGGGSNGARPREDQEDDPIVHISAGWDICVGLTRSGRIFPWRPPQSADARYQHRIHVEHAVCLRENTGIVGFEGATLEGDQFMEIAAGTDYVVAVTRMGKVFMFRRWDSPHLHRQKQRQSVRESFGAGTEDKIVIESVVDGSTHERVLEMRGKILEDQGIFLKFFSEALRDSVVPKYEEDDATERRRRRNDLHQQKRVAKLPELMLDHLPRNGSSSRSPLPTLSASFKTFALHYPSGKVLLGQEDTQAETCPVMVERLHSSVSQVVFGDYHQGVLLENGTLCTWGAFSHGALGQGDLKMRSEMPTAITGILKNKIVIGVGMAGWQSACLAIDLEGQKVFPGSYDESCRFVAKEESLVDDGCQSLDIIVTSDDSSRELHGGSSSEGLDSSDDAEWTIIGGEEFQRMSNDIGALESRAPVKREAPAPAPGDSLKEDGAGENSRSPWISSSVSSYRPHSERCTAACSLLVSPHSHGQGSINRTEPLRRRNSAAGSTRVEEAHDSRSSRCAGSRNGLEEEETIGALAVTRLGPVMRLYEPVGTDHV